MATISASIPDQLRLWIESQIEAGLYSSTSDYVRDLIRNDQNQRQQLEEMLLEGLHSGKAVAVDASYWVDRKTMLQGEHG